VTAIQRSARSRRRLREPPLQLLRRRKFLQMLLCALNSRGEPFPYLTDETLDIGDVEQGRPRGGPRARADCSKSTTRRSTGRPRCRPKPSAPALMTGGGWQPRAVPFKPPPAGGPVVERIREHPVASSWSATTFFSGVLAPESRSTGPSQPGRVNQAEQGGRSMGHLRSALIGEDRSRSRAPNAIGAVLAAFRAASRPRDYRDIRPKQHTALGMPRGTACTDSR